MRLDRLTSANTRLILANPRYAAWKASQYLQSLLSAQQLSLTASQQLDTIYSATKHSSAPDQLLLTKEKVPKLVQAFGLSGEEAGELRRVVVQSEQRLKQVIGERKVEEASGEQVKEAVESQSEVGKKQ